MKFYCSFKPCHITNLKRIIHKSIKHFILLTTEDDTHKGNFPNDEKKEENMLVQAQLNGLK